MGFKFIFCYLFIATLWKCLSSNYVLSDENETLAQSPMENPRLYQGDIVLDERDRFAIKNKHALWPNNVIPYEIDDKLLYIEYLTEQAMNHISNKTCIRFKKRTNEKNYVRIFRGLGCYSAVGRQKRMQSLSLGYGCHSVGTVIHELMHAIGFFHNHMRADRDQYLLIHWANIKKEFRNQFTLLKPYQATINTPFDYDSIMQYGPRAFSINGYSKTITPKNLKIVLKESTERKSLTNYDAISINKMYGCI